MPKVDPSQTPTPISEAPLASLSPKPPGPVEAERELEPGYVPRTRAEAIQRLRSAPRATASSEPSFRARVAAMVAGVFLASSRTTEASVGAAGSQGPAPVSTPDPARLTRWAQQVSARLGVRLEPAGPGFYRYRSRDDLARVNLERLPDGGAQLQLIVNLGFLSSSSEARQLLPDPRRYPGGLLDAFLEKFSGDFSVWMKLRPGFGLVDRFVATYMPPGPGTSPSARLSWWSDMLRVRVEEANRPREAAAERVWTPTFNVGSRLGQSFLAGQEFTLQLYVPPEDPGL
jgi:hypothetical protein